VSAVIYKGPSSGAACTQEVEIHLRWSDDAHAASGYECNLEYDGSSANIVRWNGANRPTTFVSATQLQASIGSEDIAALDAVLAELEHQIGRPIRLQVEALYGFDQYDVVLA